MNQIEILAQDAMNDTAKRCGAVFDYDKDTVYFSGGQLTAFAAALTGSVPDVAKFIVYLIDNYEGHTIFEETLQKWLAECSEATPETLTEAPAVALPAEPVIQKGFALVPMRLTQDMDDVIAEEGWQWEDLLAAAGAITSAQYDELASTPAAHTGLLVVSDDDVDAGLAAMANGSGGGLEKVVRRILESFAQGRASNAAPTAQAKRPEPAKAAPANELQRIAKWGRVYDAASRLMAAIGYHGERSTRDPEVLSLNEALKALDNGEHMPGLMPSPVVFPTAQPVPSEPVARYGDQAVFEEWLARVCPSGDATAVNNQWRESSEYADWLDDQLPVEPVEPVALPVVAWVYRTNNTHTFFGAVKPPDDAYDEGTLCPLVSLSDALAAIAAKGQA